jgi:hypothetical protein
MNAPRSLRLAVALWLLFAFAVWNVIFDRTLVLAGRRYVWAATLAARQGGPYLRIDDWMRPAIGHGIRIASLVSGAIVVASMAAIYAAHRRERTGAREEPPWPASPIR